MGHDHRFHDLRRLVRHDPHGELARDLPRDHHLHARLVECAVDAVLRPHQRFELVRVGEELGCTGQRSV